LSLTDAEIDEDGLVKMMKGIDAEKRDV
jgi:hypothetical protein